MNVAWNNSKMGDAEYLSAFHHLLLPIAYEVGRERGGGEREGGRGRRLTVCLFVCLSVCLSVCLCLYVCLFVCLFASLHVCLHFCLFSFSNISFLFIF